MPTLRSVRSRRRCRRERGDLNSRNSVTASYSTSVSKSLLFLAGVLFVTAPARVPAQTIRPGDRLVVRLFGEERPLADTVLVSESGTVILPRLGSVVVTGVPAAVLPDTLRGFYARYLRNPTVELVVLRRVVVGGEVKKPDIYYVDLNASLADVIAHAGGITEYSNNKVSVKRGDSVTPVPDWETNHTVISELQSGDQVIVGRRPWILQNLLSTVSTLAVVASLIITLRR